MNNEQLQDWLANLHEIFFNESGRNQREQAFLSTGPEAQKWSQILSKLAPQTNILLNYFMCNFDDPRLSEPLITQILSLYYKIVFNKTLECFSKNFDEVSLPSLRLVPHKTVTNSASTGQNNLKIGGYGNIAQCSSSIQICVLPEETTELVGET
ncbi:unnamed protein product [Meloidogyne enterolobii]|uniref:Uncharacterized protein n=1 Tax=Meloidogyne enterolobii TaxID=390850 RepID=A0ACB0YFQ4_MELEN